MSERHETVDIPSEQDAILEKDHRGRHADPLTGEIAQHARMFEDLREDAGRDWRVFLGNLAAQFALWLLLPIIVLVLFALLTTAGALK